MLHEVLNMARRAASSLTNIWCFCINYTASPHHYHSIVSLIKWFRGIELHVIIDDMTHYFGEAMTIDIIAIKTSFDDDADSSFPLRLRIVSCRPGHFEGQHAATYTTSSCHDVTPIWSMTLRLNNARYTSTDKRYTIAICRIDGWCHFEWKFIFSHQFHAGLSRFTI